MKEARTVWPTAGGSSRAAANRPASATCGASTAPACGLEPPCMARAARTTTPIAAEAAPTTAMFCCSHSPLPASRQRTAEWREATSVGATSVAMPFHTGQAHRRAVQAAPRRNRRGFATTPCRVVDRWLLPLAVSRPCARFAACGTRRCRRRGGNLAPPDTRARAGTRRDASGRARERPPRRSRSAPIDRDQWAS